MCATTRSGPGTDVMVVPTRIPAPWERRRSGGEEKRIVFVFGHAAPDAESFAAPNGGVSAVLEYRALGTDLFGLLLTSAASVATLVVGRKEQLRVRCSAAGRILPGPVDLERTRRRILVRNGCAHCCTTPSDDECLLAALLCWPELIQLVEHLRWVVVEIGELGRRHDGGARRK
jgi:hypothetical protein